MDAVFRRGVKRKPVLLWCNYKNCCLLSLCFSYGTFCTILTPFPSSNVNPLALIQPNQITIRTLLCPGIKAYGRINHEYSCLEQVIADA
jgi:hypothetical protein